MAKVKRTIDELRKNTKELHEYAIANSSEAEVVISEISRFANAYLANITFLVHNALSLGTSVVKMCRSSKLSISNGKSAILISS
ncbi:hypothetical protein N5V81_13710 [Escherichia coli]|nr:hypothetical protein [Escherichia coli]